LGLGRPVSQIKNNPQIDTANKERQTLKEIAPEPREYFHLPGNGFSNLQVNISASASLSGGPTQKAERNKKKQKNTHEILRITGTNK